MHKLYLIVFYCSMRRNIKTLNVDDSYSTQVKHLPFYNGAAQYRLLFLQLTGAADIMLLLIDNYDSFTYNLYQYFCELGKEVKVVRNDQIDIKGIEAFNPSHLVISPGPCTPNEAGISLQAITHFAGKLPILGVCLGHQAIAQVFGGQVVRARQVMHGKTSLIKHNGRSVFVGLNNPLTVTRYHSLVVAKHSLPACFELTAWTELDDGSVDEIMGYQHRTLPIDAVQFHPESIKTEQGHQLLANFLNR